MTSLLSNGYSTEQKLFIKTKARELYERSYGSQRGCENCRTALSKRVSAQATQSTNLHGLKNVSGTDLS